MCVCVCVCVSVGGKHLVNEFFICFGRSMFQINFDCLVCLSGFL